MMSKEDYPNPHLMAGMNVAMLYPPPQKKEAMMSDKRTHSAILFDLIDRWQRGDVSNRVLIRDLSGLAVNTDHLEARLSEMELTLSNLTLANEEARKTIDRLSALIPREANDSAGLEQERDDE